MKIVINILFHFQVYLVALHHEMTELKELCWHLIINDFVLLSKTEGFKKYVTAELLEDLLERSDLTKPTKQRVPWHLQMSEVRLKYSFYF